MSYPLLTSDDIETITLFFLFVDSDKDGFITVSEIREACAVDINNDGVISEEEKDAGADPWLTQYLSQQDLDADQKISLHELLLYNNNSKG